MFKQKLILYIRVIIHSPGGIIKNPSTFIRFTVTICFILILTQVSISQIDHGLGESNYYYVRLAPGLSAYGGNLRETNDHLALFGFALKAGVGYVFTPELSVGFDYRIADYPRTERSSVGNYTHNHTVNLFANYTFLSVRDFQSYVLGGIGMTFFGLYDDPHKF